MNTIILAAIISWVAAQFARVAFGLLRNGICNRHLISWRLVRAGGMPSAHSSLVASTTLALSLSAGTRSPLFGLSFIAACIVIYDRSRMHAIYRTFQRR